MSAHPSINPRVAASGVCDQAIASSDRHSLAERRRADSGFTLVELIVASTLMALVLSAIYLTFSTTVRAWRSGESNYAPYQDARRALGLLEREFAAIPVDARHLFIGKRDEVEFVTLSPTLDVDLAAGLQLVHVRYRIVDIDDAPTLVREEAAVILPLPEAPAPGDIGLPAQLKTGRRSQFGIARNVLGFDLVYRWPAPPDPNIPRGVMPPPVPILSTDRVDYATPQGLIVRLTVADPGNISGGQATEFDQVLTLKIEPSPIPEALLRKSRV